MKKCIMLTLLFVTLISHKAFASYRTTFEEHKVSNISCADENLGSKAWKHCEEAIENNNLDSSQMSLKRLNANSCEVKTVTETIPAGNYSYPGQTTIRYFYIFLEIFSVMTISEKRIR